MILKVEVVQIYVNVFKNKRHLLALAVKVLSKIVLLQRIKTRNFWSPKALNFCRVRFKLF